MLGKALVVSVVLVAVVGTFAIVTKPPGPPPRSYVAPTPTPMSREALQARLDALWANNLWEAFLRLAEEQSRAQELTPQQQEALAAARINVGTPTPTPREIADQFVFVTYYKGVKSAFAPVDEALRLLNAAASARIPSRPAVYNAAKDLEEAAQRARLPGAPAALSKANQHLQEALWSTRRFAEKTAEYLDKGSLEAQREATQHTQDARRSQLAGMALILTYAREHGIPLPD